MTCLNTYTRWHASGRPLAFHTQTADFINLSFKQTCTSIHKCHTKPTHMHTAFSSHCYTLKHFWHFLSLYLFLRDQMCHKQRGVTYVSGNSTGLLLILLWSASMYSSINGHWRTRKKNREGEEGDGWVIKIINHINVTAVAHCPIHWSFW